MKVGLDVVAIERVGALDEAARRKVFHREEMQGASAERLAGVFALKEACKKIFGPALPWLDVSVSHREDGAPVVVVASRPEAALECSLSHDGGIAAAVVILVENPSGR